MKKLLLIAALLVSANAMAMPPVKWNKIETTVNAEGESFTLYVLNKSRMVKGDEVTLMTLMSSNNIHGASMVYLRSFDCKRKLHKAIWYATYLQPNMQGEILTSGDLTGKYRSIKGLKSKRTFNYACAK